MWLLNFLFLVCVRVPLEVDVCMYVSYYVCTLCRLCQAARHMRSSRVRVLDSSMHHGQSTQHAGRPCLESCNVMSAAFESNVSNATGLPSIRYVSDAISHAALAGCFGCHCFPFAQDGPCGHVHEYHLPASTTQPSSPCTACGSFRSSEHCVRLLSIISALRAAPSGTDNLGLHVQAPWFQRVHFPAHFAFGYRR
jgi:hypothetical protein